MRMKIIFYIVSFNISIFAQMNGLEITPHQINFTNKFEKIKTVTIKNNGPDQILIDSLTYDASMLYIRNNDFVNFPIMLESDSVISIDVLITNFFSLKGDDSSTVISFYNSSKDSIKSINVNIDFQMYRRLEGIVNGTVRDSSNLLDKAKLYFFFDGIYLIDSTITDNNGYYEKELPYGRYFVAANKLGYYMQYGYQKNSPLEANFTYIKNESPQIVDFILEAEIETNISIDGVVFDIVSDGILNEAVVVVRKGDHTPTKALAIEDDMFRSYAVKTNSKGEFRINNIKAGGNYYLQAFAGHYIPGYFNKNFVHTSFWQNADSIDLFESESNKNIYLQRDSSYGGGIAKGFVRHNNNQSDSAKNVILYAISNTDNKIYNYSFSKSIGNFEIPALPSGNYTLVTDLVGFESSVSSSFTIDVTQDTVQNIELLLLPTSVEYTPQIVNSFDLSQNYPNPFNPTTTIEFSISESSDVVLSIFNVLGQKVAVLINDNLEYGKYKIQFDASQLSSGIYIYQLKSNSTFISKKMELLK